MALAAAILEGSVAVLAPASARAEPMTCGAPSKPPCPLQRWMREELARPLATGQLAELAAAFERLARSNPEPKAWANWMKFTRDGARAAREGRRSGAIVACARCHSVYRPEYNVKHRTRAVRD